MANEDGPNGLTPIGHASGGTPGRLNEYGIAAAYGTDIFKGDLVHQVTGGTIELAAVTTVGLAGVFMGVMYKNSAGEQVFSKYWDSPSSATDIKALISDDPNTEYRVQTGGSLALTDMGANADSLATHAGNTTTGRSGVEVSGTSGTGTAQLRLVRLFDAPDNAFGTNAEVVVRINEHRATNRTGI